MDQSAKDDGSVSTEERMRRALGLDRREEGVRPARPFEANGGAGTKPQAIRRRFARDGEVAVEHRSTPPKPASSDMLDTARNAVRTHAAARERAERDLATAQAAMRSLQTQLAHERMAREEAVAALAALRQVHAHTEAALHTAQEAAAADKLARASAEAAVQELSRPAPQPRSPHKKRAEPKRAASPRARKEREPQPVKWWIKRKPRS